ncbi:MULTISPECIES: cytochrome [Actinomycetes]|uniref:PD-(D/E)XK nuclease family protein n=2 Tax=Actinomycetes TaxID=1760 RepID=A0ABP6LSX6_9MICC|nr:MULTISPECIES: cytochrome [unclassified Nesterenkonia]MDS2171512.1 cytochrome [Nesterenkonia sp. CL21]OSM43367.1 cytochrome [Nesterenkonia sp. PF2B19]
MTQPTLAHATEFGRMYSRSLTSAPEVPSITTVIGQEHKDLTGWAGHLATQELIQDDRLAAAVGSASQLKTLARHAASAAERFRDAAAQRGDRVHHYAEQVALRALGTDHEVDTARATLVQHGETAFADRFDEWWDLYGVRPLAAEVTVWNHTIGYAGTLDLIAEIAGRTCVIDFKTKGLDRRGRAKPLSESVVMQLVAGMQAEERLVDAQAGIWEPWPHGQDCLLMAVAVSETEVVPVQATPAALKAHWHKFWALRQVWEHGRRTAEAGPSLRPLAPPPAAASAGATTSTAKAPGGDGVPPVTPAA